VKLLDKAEQLPAFMPTANRPINAGASIDDDASRLDGLAKVTGAAKYAKDTYLDRSVFIGFIRCPLGAAVLEGSDAVAAKSAPGVLEVEIDAKECTYHGQPVGHVVAESPLALKRALAALKLKWKRRQVNTRISDSVTSLPAPDAKAAKILEGAELKLEAVYSTPVQTHSSLETHGGVVDHRGDRATIYASTQGTSSVKDGIGSALGLNQSEFEVICEYIGGGFGSKLGGPGKEMTLAAKISAKYKRPAYLFCNRAEEHLDTGNRPSSQTLVRIGFKKDGTILGGEIRTWGGVGVGRGGGGVNIPSGRYAFGEIDKNHQDVSLNAGGPRPFRAPGHPQGAFAEELMVDELAAATGLDPLALRRKLLTDSVYAEMFDLGEKLIGWKDRKPNGAQDSVVRVGYGVGTTNWRSASPGGNAEVVINRDGSVESRTGTQDIGTGQRTTMGVVTAHAIGIPLSLVTVRIGHSTLPPGPGSGGSVTSPTTAPTMTAAAAAAKEKFLEFVARQSQAAPAELTVDAGNVLRSGKPFLTWAEACSRLPSEGVLGSASTGEGGKGSSQGAQFVRLEIDSETGIIRVRHVIAIQSCGRVICRKTAESQIIGGVIQGLSYALFENRILDRNVGAMVNPNFEWYKVLGPGDMPHVEPVLWTHGQTGVKALGEPPTVPTAGAVACAVFNALGRPIRDLPFTPDKVLAALQGASA
jgi:xanthine dehydrogenase YagR molybdenum-binding subunit